MYIQKLFILAIALFAVGCKKDFLNRTPQTTVREEIFFKTPSDLEIYTNGFYGMMLPVYEDIYSDNISTFTGQSTVDAMIRGTVTPANVSGWNAWPNIRRINFMLTHLSEIKGNTVDIKHYVGIARFFRGYVYYQEVKKYGDLPWYNKAIAYTDEAELTRPKDPRTLVVDSVMADLEYAVANIKVDAENTRITKWAALTLLARVALHEGTFRKYHTELNLQSTADRFIERAATASQAVIDGTGAGKPAITTAGGATGAFRNLFCSNNLTGNTEVIFLNKNSKADGVTNNTHTVFNYQWGLTSSLTSEFLMKDGTRFTDVAGYESKKLTEIFADRDPRLAETAMQPGFSTTPTTTNAAFVVRPDFGGYLQVKFYPRDPALRGGFQLNYTDLPIMRFAEVLLINAEAKAELGTLTQADLDKTVNVLRTRVSMPTLSLATANGNIDPLLASRYDNVTGANRGVIYEIRRERRVELACEGFRYDDLMRWKMGKLLVEDPKGMYIPALGPIDVTGDGKVDIAILENPTATGPLAQLPPAQQTSIAKYYLSDNVFYLSNTTSGNVMFVNDKLNKRQFLDKYYYFPIPLQQITLNPNLKQPSDW
jgi:hypothetical protein